MIEFNTHPKVIVDLENGLYEMDLENGIGKTYLCNLLKHEANCLCVTYDDIDNLKPLDEIFSERKPALCIFDRYDMYPGKFDDEIRKYAKSAIILFDAKHYDGLSDSEWCMIERTKDKIEVNAI